MPSKSLSWTHMPTEKQLDAHFAQTLVNNPLLSIWMLQQTPYADCASDAKLLNAEQAMHRPKVKPENWFRHWWCPLPDGSESETDILACYEIPKADNTITLALHIENKPPWGTFGKEQVAKYAERARYMKDNPSSFNYDEFLTVILAPMSFINSNSTACSEFDVSLSYEDVSIFSPLFTQ